MSRSITKSIKMVLPFLSVLILESLLDFSLFVLFLNERVVAVKVLLLYS